MEESSLRLVVDWKDPMIGSTLIEAKSSEMERRRSNIRDLPRGRGGEEETGREQRVSEGKKMEKKERKWKRKKET